MECAAVSPRRPKAIRSSSRRWSPCSSMKDCWSAERAAVDDRRFVAGLSSGHDPGAARCAPRPARPRRPRGSRARSRSKARSSIAGPSSSCRPRRAIAPRRTSALGSWSGIFFSRAGRAFVTSRLSASATSYFVTSPMSRCPRRCGRSCTRRSPAGSKNKAETAPRNSTRFSATTCSRPTVTGRTSARSMSVAESSPRTQRAISRAPDRVHTRVVTCRERATLLARALTLMPTESADRADVVLRLDDARFELGEYRKATAESYVAAAVTGTGRSVTPGR